MPKSATVNIFERNFLFSLGMWQDGIRRDIIIDALHF